VRTARANAAFTLFEVLVTLSIVVLILGIAYGTYAAATRSVLQCRSRSVIEQEARAILTRMAREIRCACIRQNALKKDDAGTLKAWREGDAAPFAGGNQQDGDLLRFVTAADSCVPDEPSAGLTVVAYRLDAASKTLLRSQTTIVADTQPDCQPFARNVLDVELEFFDGERWQNQWDYHAKKRLPEAVRIAVTLEDRTARRATVATAAWISAASPDVAEVADGGLAEAMR